MVSVLSLMIKDTKTILKTVNKLRDVLDHTTTDHLRLVSPVLRLPFELLSEIFVLSAEQTVRTTLHRNHIPYFHRTYRVQAEASGALNVAQVCRKWREVALSTPSLWNAILH
ncbi:hypothetical protein CONPUDRAFT_50072, partial [Coniophora puteana RWD-64-598 SS2]